MGAHAWSRLSVVVGVLVFAYGAYVLIVGGVLNVGGPRQSAWVWGAIFVFAGVGQAVQGLMRLRRMQR